MKNQELHTEVQVTKKEIQILSKKAQRKVEPPRQQRNLILNVSQLLP
jgi:hypothetical protein